MQLFKLFAHGWILKRGLHDGIASHTPFGSEIDQDGPALVSGGGNRFTAPRLPLDAFRLIRDGGSASCGDVSQAPMELPLDHLQVAKQQQPDNRGNGNASSRLTMLHESAVHPRG